MRVCYCPFYNEWYSKHIWGNKPLKRISEETFFEIKTVSIVARSNTRGYC